MRNSAHLLEALHPDLDGLQLLHGFWRTLRTGDAHELSDSAIELADGLLLLTAALSTRPPARASPKTCARSTACWPPTPAPSCCASAPTGGAPPLDAAVAANVADPRDLERVMLVQLDPESQESRNPGLALRAVARVLAPRLAAIGTGHGSWGRGCARSRGRG